MIDDTDMRRRRRTNTVHTEYARREVMRRIRYQVSRRALLFLGRFLLWGGAGCIVAVFLLLLTRQLAGAARSMGVAVFALVASEIVGHFRRKPYKPGKRPGDLRNDHGQG